jgi:hypothetical protein
LIVADEQPPQAQRGGRRLTANAAKCGAGSLVEPHPGTRRAGPCQQLTRSGGSGEPVQAVDVLVTTEPTFPAPRARRSRVHGPAARAAGRRSFGPKSQYSCALLPTRGTRQQTGGDASRPRSDRGIGDAAAVEMPAPVDQDALRPAQVVGETHVGHRREAPPFR